MGPRTFWDRRWRAFDECSSPSASHSSHTYGKAKKNRKNSKIFGKFGTSPVELYVTSDGYKCIMRTVWVHTSTLGYSYVHNESLYVLSRAVYAQDGCCACVTKARFVSYRIRNVSRVVSNTIKQPPWPIRSRRYADIVPYYRGSWEMQVVRCCASAGWKSGKSKCASRVHLEYIYVQLVDKYISINLSENA